MLALDEIMDLEFSVTSGLGLKRRQTDFIRRIFRETRGDAKDFVANSKELREKLSIAHNRTKERLAASRKLGKKKGQEKRHILRGASSAIIGGGLIAANTTVVPAAAPYSYAVGGGSVISGIRDLFKD